MTDGLSKTERRDGDDLKRQRLLVHRELQFLRAGGWRPRKGHGKQKRQWVAERARKLQEAKRRA